MLRWSANEQGDRVDLDALASGAGDPGVPHGPALMTFAAASTATDDDALEVARTALVDQVGESAMVDAAAVVANFEMMTRLADGTGSQVPAPMLSGARRMAARFGIDHQH